MAAQAPLSAAARQAAAAAMQRFTVEIAAADYVRLFRRAAAERTAG
jgi:hypothetical protein